MIGYVEQHKAENITRSQDLQLGFPCCKKNRITTSVSKAERHPNTPLDVQKSSKVIILHDLSCKFQKNSLIPRIYHWEIFKMLSLIKMLTCCFINKLVRGFLNMVILEIYYNTWYDFFLSIMISRVSFIEKRRRLELRIRQR